jgi:hypothetical protein
MKLRLIHLVQQVDLRTNIKLNGIMSEEIVKMHQSVSSFKPTIWLSADRWKMNMVHEWKRQQHVGTQRDYEA